MALSFSIKPLLRTDKPIKQNGKYPINFLVRIGNKQIKVPSKKEIEEKFWNKEEGRSKKSYPNSSTLNSSLAKAEQEFRDFMYRQELSGRNVGINEIRDFFKGCSSVCFYEFFKEVVRVKELKPNTIRVYNTTFTILKQFRRNISFGDLTPLFVQQFNHFLITVRKNNIGGIYNRHKILKSVILEAIKNGLIQKNPYLGFKVRKPYGKKTFLKFEEVQKIENLEFNEDSPHLLKTRNIFLFSCYCIIRLY